MINKLTKLGIAVMFVAALLWVYEVNVTWTGFDKECRNIDVVNIIIFRR